MTIAALAEANFETHIRRNPYPGRGLVIGRSAAGDWVLVYWVMGRSANSRNRRLTAAGGVLRTEPIDAARIEKADLIIYEAMLELPGVYLVSNGDQTRTLHEALRAGGTFDEALRTREREPDAPNYTPRISGMLAPGDDVAPITLSILKANAADPARTDRFTYRPAPPPPGFGYGLTTYRGDGDPLPPFVGEPLWLPLPAAPAAIEQAYWDGLNAANRVALAVKVVAGGGSRLRVRNRDGLAQTP